MKHVQAYLSAGEDRKSSYYRCGDPVLLLQACLCVGRTSKRRFNLPGGAVKHVQACLSAMDDRESSLHHCGGPVRLVEACLCSGKT